MQNLNSDGAQNDNQVTAENSGTQYQNQGSTDGNTINQELKNNPLSGTETSQNMAGQVQNAGQQAVSQAKDIAGQATAQVQNVAGQVQNAGQQAVSQAKDIAGQATAQVQNVAGQVQNAGQQAVSQAKDIAGQATAQVQNVAGQVQNAGQQAVSQAKDIAGQATAQVQNVAGQVQDLGQAGIDKVAQTVNRFTGQSQDPNQPAVSKEEKIYGGLAYLPFVSIISIIMKPDSAFVRLHSKQGTVLSLLFFFSGILAAFVTLFGLFGQILAVVIGFIPLFCMVVGGYSIFMALTGYWWKIPVISQVADLIPIEFLAKTSKENITGQVGVAKEDYDERAEAVKQNTLQNQAPQSQSVPDRIAEAQGNSVQDVNSVPSGNGQIPDNTKQN